MRFFRSLLFQVVLWAILPLLAITAVSVVSIYGHQQAERDLVAQRVARLAHIASGTLSNELEDRARILQAFGKNGLTAARNGRPMDQVVADPALLGSFDRGLLWLSVNGEAAAVSGDARGWAGSAAVPQLRARARATNAPVVAGLPGNGRATFTLLAVPGPEDGTLVGGLSLASLGLDHLLDDLQLGARGSGFIVDASGAVLYATGPSGETVQQAPGAAILPGVKQAEAGESGAVFSGSGSDLFAVGYAPVPLTGWSVVVRESWADAVGPMARFSVLTPLLVILAALVSLVAVYLILSYVIRPLRTLGGMAERVAWGDFAAVKGPVAGVQEIGDLHATLRHTVEQIRRYQAGMQSYVTAVTQGQEEERRRLARELHDDTAQSLIGLMQRIKLARRDLKRDPARAEERLAELEELSMTTWQDVRRFSEALRPAYLEQFGLEPALRTLCEQAGVVPGAPACSFRVEGEPRRLRSEIEVALFRIVQEALNNVRQHASASRVHVNLKYDAESVAVIVADDGRGFDPPVSPGELAASGHYGLAGIRERALLIGGHLAIVAAPGRGTRIEVTVPSPDISPTENLDAS